MSELTDQQKRFVSEYLLDLNAGQAARRAGYSDTSGASLYAQGSRLLRNVNVSAAIDKALGKRAERLEIKADRVLKELARVAFSDIRHVAEWDGESMRYLSSEVIDDEAGAAIAEITDKTTETTAKNGETTSVRREQRVKMHDKMRALEMLGKHLGLFKADDSPAANSLEAILRMLEAGGVGMDQIVAHLAQKKAGV